MTRIWTALTSCLDDYTVDSRGDVGSWIRISACESLLPVFKYTSHDNLNLTIGKLLRLSVEKMDRVRIAAGQTLRTLALQWAEADATLRIFVEG